jgi:hypothetical protein
MRRIRAGLSTRWQTGLFLLLLGCPSAAIAQSGPAQTAGVSPGQNVVVTTSDGKILNAKVDATDLETVTVVDRGAKRVLRFREIETIELRKDPLWNGALYGLGLGVIAGALAADTSKNEDPFCGMGFDQCGGGNIAVPIVAVGTLGALIGASIDVFIVKRDRTIYRRGPKAMLVPEIGVARQGISVLVVW